MLSVHLKNICAKEGRIKSTQLRGEEEKMSEEVPELPPEVKLEMAISSWASFLYASWAKAVENTPGDTFDMRYEKWYDDIMPSAEMLISRFVTHLASRSKLIFRYTRRRLP